MTDNSEQLKMIKDIKSKTPVKPLNRENVTEIVYSLAGKILSRVNLSNAVEDILSLTPEPSLVIAEITGIEKGKPSICDEVEEEAPLINPDKIIKESK